MASGSAFDKREMLSMAADGAVITAGVYAAMLGLAFMLEWAGVAPMSEPQGSGWMLVLTTISWLLQAGGLFIGPLVAWILYRRGFSRKAILGGVLGMVVGVGLVFPVAFLASGLNWMVAAISPYEFAGAIAFLVIIVALFLAAIVWADFDAARDLVSDERAHVALDVARILATLATAAFTAVVLYMVSTGEDAFEAQAFVLLAAVVGALVFTAASTIARLLDSGSATNPSAQA